MLDLTTRPIHVPHMPSCSADRDGILGTLKTRDSRDQTPEALSDYTGRSLAGVEQCYTRPARCMRQVLLPRVLSNHRCRLPSTAQARRSLAQQRPAYRPQGGTFRRQLKLSCEASRRSGGTDGKPSAKGTQASRFSKAGLMTDDARHTDQTSGRF